MPLDVWPVRRKGSHLGLAHLLIEPPVPLPGMHAQQTAICGLTGEYVRLSDASEARYICQRCETIARMRERKEALDES